LGRKGTRFRLVLVVVLLLDSLDDDEEDEDERVQESFSWRSNRPV
jgi:hypothetical protein